MGRYTHIQNRNGHYHFRTIIPKHLTLAFNGKREIICSLKTKDLQEAKRRALYLTQSSQELFMKIDRATRLNQEEIKSIIQQYFHECVQRLKEQQYKVENFSDFAEDMQLIPALKEVAEFNEPTKMMERKDFLLPPKSSNHKQEFTIAGFSFSESKPSTQQIKEYIMKAHELDISDKTPTGKMFERALERALLELKSLHRQAINYEPEFMIKDEWFKEPIKTIEATFNSLTDEVTEHQKSISEVFDEYIAEQQVNDKTKEKRRAEFNAFIELNGDLTIGKIDKNLARKYKQDLQKVPVNHKQKFKGESLKETVKKELTGYKLLSIKSINSYIQTMTAVINWAIDNGYYNKNNPFTGTKLKESKNKEKPREPFSTQQLQILFSSPVYTGCKSKGRRTEKGGNIIKDSLYWLPILSLFSGARMQELCQLRFEDIIEIDKIPCFKISDEEYDQSTKSSSSIRTIPIHKQVIELGFLDYVKKQQSGRLFPCIEMSKSGNYSNTFSKRFGRYMDSCFTNKGKTSFHSFRHTIADAFRDAGVQEEIANLVTGHKNKSVYSNYGSSDKTKLLKKHLDKVTYDIDWTKIK